MNAPLKLVAGNRGPEVRNDCWIQIHRDRTGIQLRSTVERLYGKMIRQTLDQAAQELGIQDLGIEVEDSGAFDFCLRARLEAAAFPLTSRWLSVRRDERSRSQLETFQTRLYLPGNTPKYFINASLHGPDGVILDLEDSVPLDQKQDARSLVRHALGEVDFGPCQRIVRPNRHLEGSRDLEAIRGCGAEVLLVPKVESSQELDEFGEEWALIPLIESALGLENAFSIASHPAVVAISLGVEDYTTDLGARSQQATVLDHAYSRIVNAARAAGVAPLGSVYSQVNDVEGFAESTRQLADRGITGVGCLHPKQVPVAKMAFRPTEDEVDWAEQVVAGADRDSGAIAVQGQMIDAPLVKRAESILRRSGQSDWRFS